MKELRTILYATDFSESSAAACETACYLAELAGAKVHVLHVLGELADQRKARIPAEAFAIFEKEVEAQAIKEMATFCRDKFAPPLEHTTEIVVGTPFEAILDKAAQAGADLIVMGTHGRTGIEHVLLGSTAERVVRRSTIAVLTVRSAP
ncbi:MAG: universal stress protein [Desulfuromonas sp.]|uniref:universal stress protein n=1 Tax=Desulfuromonas sp. TaxID=892 RepID=UPI000CB98FDF|nr:universal stress protein [Desulfuromonas sp.]PLX83634.1 MAG: universal stress protein [Desulfuromonas sp.]